MIGLSGRSSQAVGLTINPESMKMFRQELLYTLAACIFWLVPEFDSTVSTTNHKIHYPQQPAPLGICISAFGNLGEAVVDDEMLYNYGLVSRLHIRDFRLQIGIEPNGPFAFCASTEISTAAIPAGSVTPNRIVQGIVLRKPIFTNEYGQSGDSYEKVRQIVTHSV